MLSLESKGNLGQGGAGAVGCEKYYHDTTVDDHAACGLPGLADEQMNSGVTYAFGPGAERTGLRDGQHLTREDVRDMLRGDWKFGAVQNAHSPDRYMAVDATFSAPKDVSVVWAASDPARRKVIYGCHRDATHDAFENVLAPALYTRRGHCGTEREPVVSFPNGSEQHMSRSDDPDLHTHFTTPSYGLRADKTVGTIEFDNWYGLAHLADAHQMLRFAELLRDRAGIDLVMGGDGKLRVLGVDPRLAEEFSRRTREMIAAYEQAHGKGSWEQATSAEHEAWAVKTRPKHNRSFQEDFRERARAAGLEIEFVAAGKLGGRTRALTLEERDAMLDKHIRDAAHVQVHGGYSVGSRDKIPGDAWVEERKILAEAGFRAVGAGATAADVRAALGRAIERGEIVQFGHERTRGAWDAPLSTREMVALEQRSIDDLVSLARLRTEPVPEAIVREEIAKWERAHKAKLAPDQEKAVRAATSGRRAVIIIGPAGSSKTTVQEIVNNAWARAGREVTGEAPTGKARLELINGAKVAAVTHDTAMARGRDWGPRTVALADEAGFASSASAASLHADALARGAVLVKSGDPLQLQPVGPGAPFRHEIAALAKIDPGAVVTLSKVRRQRDAEVKMIAETAAKGWPGDALVAAYEAGRLRVHGEHREAVSAAARDVAKWTAEGRDAQAIVPTRRDADLANRTVREALRERGLLPREEVTYNAHVDAGKPGRLVPTEHSVTMPGGAVVLEPGYTRGWAPRARPWEKEAGLSVGDRVSLTENRADLGVQNGSPGRVVGFSPKGDVSIRLDERWLRVDRDGRPLTDRQTVYDAAGNARMVEGREAAQHVTVRASEVARPTQDGRYTFVAHDFARTGHRVQGGEAEAVSIAAGVSGKQLDAQWANTAVTRSVSDLRVHLSSHDLRGPAQGVEAALDPHGHYQSRPEPIVRDPDRAALRAAEVAQRNVEHARERLENAQFRAERARESLADKRERAGEARERLQRAEQRLDRAEHRLTAARQAGERGRVPGQADHAAERGGRSQVSTPHPRDAVVQQRMASRLGRAEQGVEKARERVERAQDRVARAETGVVKADHRVARADAGAAKTEGRLAKTEQRQQKIAERLDRAREAGQTRARSRGNGEIRSAESTATTERDVVLRAAERANELRFGRTTLDFSRHGQERGIGREGGAVRDRLGRAQEAPEHRPERHAERSERTQTPPSPPLDRGYEQGQDHGLSR